MFDWISIILLLACVGTHIDDIVNHTTYKAQLHIRLMSVTIIIVCIRLLKTSQTLFTRFGAIVQMVLFASGDILYWFVLYCFIWLPMSEF